MNRRSMLTLITAALAWSWILFSASGAVAQQEADLEGVKAASKAFYEALAVVDNGEAMEKVWAPTPYVTLIGPRSKSVIVGWDVHKKYWPEANKLFTSRNVSLSNSHSHINGNLAWEIGEETGEAKRADGTAMVVDAMVTNIYEKQEDGRWLMVSHHTQPKPQ